MLYSKLKNIMFRSDPERMHNFAISSLRVLQKLPPALKIVQNKMQTNTPELRSKVWNIDFANPIGLAAGFDKDASVYQALWALGFGFVEVGTITPKPQLGNPTPRLFRLPEEQAIINRMGFNNCGALAAEANLRKLKKADTLLGINIGKNKDTPNEEAHNEYIYSLRLLYKYGNYFVINVSSPNTANLRKLQQGKHLERLLTPIITERNNLAKADSYRPLLLKIAPDMSQQEIAEIGGIALATGIDGVIATNTTIGRFDLNSRHKDQSGGLSGKPLTSKANDCIHQLYTATNGKLPIIGVGGVFTGQDAYDKIKAGASLIQVYTGMIYRGPRVAKIINKELHNLMEQDGVRSLEEIIGVE